MIKCSEQLLWKSLRVIGPLLVLLVFYTLQAWLTTGPGVWWHIDVVGNTQIYWGDDAYRFFLARSLWLQPDILWFNFALPVALFLDHLVIWLAQHDLLWARYIKAALAVVALGLLWCVGRKMQLRASALALSLALLGLMPLYFFVAMSFYGEAWLTVLICLALFVQVSQHYRLAALLIGLLPLIRPEGILLVWCYTGWLLLAGYRWHALLPLVPGGLYFLSIFWPGPGAAVFLQWRAVVEQAYLASGGWYGSGAEQFPRVVFLPWLIAAVVGAWLPECRAVRPLFLGALLIFLLFSFVAFGLGTASFEPRYLMPILPVLTLGFAAVMARVMALLDMVGFRRAGMAGMMTVVAVVCLAAQARSLLGIDRVASHYLQYGSPPEDVKPAPFAIGSYFHGISEWSVARQRETADVVTRMAQVNRAIDVIVVGSIHVFYHLDPAALPEGIGVVFLPVPSVRLLPALGGNVTGGYYARSPYASYYRIDVAQPGKAGQRQLLYVDRLGRSDYPFHWQVGENDIYLFSYSEHAL